MGISVGLLDHYNLRTRKFSETVRFYEEVLGLANGARPDFSEPGAWLYSEGRPVLHLIDLRATDEPQKPDSGVVHHVAFASRGFADMKAHLSAKGLEFRTQEVPGTQVWQIFVHDPNGLMVELNYDPAAEARP